MRFSCFEHSRIAFGCLLSLWVMVFDSISATSFEDQPSTQALLATYQGHLHYNEVSWLSSHNSFASHADGWEYAQQSLDITQQLEYGVRVFMLDLYWYWDSIAKERYVALCHEDSKLELLNEAFNIFNTSNCFFTTGIALNKQPKNILESMQEIKRFLDSHPTEIITLFFESYIGDASAIKSLLTQSKLEDYLYLPSPKDIVKDRMGLEAVNTWPTLLELRRVGKRLIIFDDNVMDGKIQDGIIHVNSYRETEYSLREYPNCEMREESRDVHGQRHLMLLNHFYSTSYNSLNEENNYDTSNSFNSIMNRIEICQTSQMIPNFVAVDFVESGAQGGAREVVTALNMNRNYSQATSTPSQMPTGTAASTNQSNRTVSSDRLTFWSTMASTLLVGASYKWHCLTKPAKITSTVALVSHFQSIFGFAVPMTFAPVAYALLGIAAEHSYNFLHPIHWLIWMTEHDGRNPARYRR